MNTIDHDIDPAGSAAEASADTDAKAAVRAAWSLGDYHRFAKATIWGLGPILVRACGIGPGQRVLDVAAGTGNTAIRAAQAGAEVVASDLTPENFPAGMIEAESVGVELEWVQADAEALPFEDAAFDVVTSSFGAIFAPHHQAVADELTRVCRPGGTIGMLAFDPAGLITDLLDAVAPYLPAPAPDTQPPPRWGDEGHVRQLFGDRVQSLDFTHDQYVETTSDPRAYVDLFRDTFGPITAIYAALADDLETRRALDGDLLEFATRCNRGPEHGPARYPYDYLLIIARR